MLAAAFKNGVTDIIAFDYWSKELDEIKVKARSLAVKAAKNKSETLLGELLEVVPPIVNVQEQTTVHFPDSLYHSFVNTNNEEFANSWRREIPFYSGHSAANTYYRGLNSAGDIQPLELPMKPEISVVSTVRLYFESPAANKQKRAKKKAKSVRGEVSLEPRETSKYVFRLCVGKSYLPIQNRLKNTIEYIVVVNGTDNVSEMFECDSEFRCDELSPISCRAKSIAASRACKASFKAS